MQLSLLTITEPHVSPDVLWRILNVLESLDDLGADAHYEVSGGACARAQFWATVDESKQAMGHPERREEPECTCEMGAVILELSNALKVPTVRYRHAGERFGEIA